MKKAVLALAIGALTFGGTVFSYDKELARRFNGMFSQMTPEVIKQRPCQITTQQLLQMIQKGEDFVILDVRTPAEMAVVGPTWKNTLYIPMHELFKEENLNRLPKDKKIVVVCHTGDRAAAVVTALRALGFDKAFQFRGGMTELAKEVGRAATEYVK
ncbi:MAG: rhodanese-like domain-containing protein [Aquificaceae bacterium]|jgi:rhodanese-related sulfurtransferase|uniref:rhodanese-like domain-containing protein n=1 Tax=Hydrogenobacter sp. Uz 6-8 TaxID=3384828 RepID=UPI00309C25BD